MCIMGDVQVVYLKKCELFVCLHSSAMAVLYHVSVDAVDPVFFISYSILQKSYGDVTPAA